MQGTVTKWKVRRDRAKLTPEIPVEKFATVERAIREAERYDLIIIDGPAHAEKGGKVMAAKSDLILMPTCYGLDDLEAQVEAAYELEAEGIDHNRIWFVFSRTSGSPIEDQAARDYLHVRKSTFLSRICRNCPQSGRATMAEKQRRKSAFRSSGNGLSRLLWPLPT